jgi:hypothetical protein
LGHANEHGISANTRFEVCIAKDYPETGFDLAAFFDCLFTTWGEMGDPAGAAAHVTIAKAGRRVDGRRADGRRPPRRQFEPGRPTLITLR